MPAVVYDPDFAELRLANNWVGSILECDPDCANFGELAVYDLTGPVGSPSLDFVNLVYSDAERTWADYPPNDNFAPQLGATNRIYCGDSRLQNLVFRDGSYYTAQTIFTPTNNATTCTVQWWEFTHGSVDAAPGCRAGVVARAPADRRAVR